MSEAKTDFSIAMWRLLEDKDLDDITVVDIVKVSGHSHASFYRHFKDKHDLMLYSCEVLLKSQVIRGIQDPTPEAIIEPFLHIAMNNRRKFLHALSSLDERALRRQILETITHYAQMRFEGLSSSEYSINTRHAGLMFSNSIMGIFIDWLSGDVQLSYAEMQEILIQWLRRLSSINPDDDLAASDTSFDRKRLEDIVRQMLKTSTIDNLRVGKIIEAAGINRTAFYRHYSDKYDIVNRTFEREANAWLTIELRSKRLVLLNRERMISYLEHLLENRSVVLNALSETEPNSLRPYAARFFTQLILDLAEQSGVENTDQIELVVRMFCIGAVGHVIFWLRDPKQDIEDIYSSLRLLFPADVVFGTNSHDVVDTKDGDNT